MATIFTRLRNLTRLERRRVDTTLTRLRRHPALMFVFNAFLITLNGFVRLWLFLGRTVARFRPGKAHAEHLQSMSVLPHPQGHQIQGRPARVLLIVEETVPQCFTYRVQQKLAQLEILGWAAEWVSWREHNRARERMHFADIVLFYRVPGFPDVLQLIDYANHIKRITIFDVDDLIFDEARLREKFTHNTGQLPGHERAAMMKGASLYRAAMERCSYGISSTQRLADIMQPLLAEKQCFVLPNGISEQLVEAAEARTAAKPSGFIDIFYGSGTRTHDEDFAMVAPALLRVLRESPVTRLIVAGHLTIPDQLGPYRGRILQLPLLPFRSYLSVLAQADISIAPLEAGIFADCKSEIKWLEAAVLGVPSIVSETATYRTCIEDVKTGFIATGSGDWERILLKLIDDADLRATVGRRAREAAWSGYSMEKLASRFDQSLRRCLDLARASGRVVRPDRERKKILMVNAVYPPGGGGGATVVMMNIMRELRANYANEYSTAVFTCDGENPIPYQLNEYGHEGVTVTALSVPTNPDLEWKYRDEEIERVFREYLDCQRPDLVHFHSCQRLTGSVLQAARSAGVPFVVTVHDAWWISDHQFMLDDDGRLVDERQTNPLVAAGNSRDPIGTLERQDFLREQLRGAESVIAVSEYQRGLYRLNGFDRIVLNRNGVTRNPPSRTGKGAPRVAGPLRVGYIGGIARHKGYYFLEQAVRESALPDIEFTIVDFDQAGDTTRVEIWGESKARFVAPSPPAQMPEFYEGIDVLVAPSIWPESFGLVTREASLAGKWVVASDAGGLAEQVREGVTGHVFPMGDLAAFKTILQRLQQHMREYLMPPSSAAIAEVGIISLETQVQELVGLYRGIINQGNKHEPSKPAAAASHVTA